MNCKSNLHARHVLDGPGRGLCVGFGQQCDRVDGSNAGPSPEQISTLLATTRWARSSSNATPAGFWVRRGVDRTVRIMVTMSSDAAHDYGLVHDLLRNGMDCMRINCAHDDPALWSAMIRNLRRARAACKRDCTLLMDLAGPKIRTGPIEPGPAVIKIRPSRDAYGRVTKPARILLTAKQSAKESGADAVLFADEKLLAGLRRGDSLRFLDTRGRRRRLERRRRHACRCRDGNASNRLHHQRHHAVAAGAGQAVAREGRCPRHSARRGRH